MFEAGCQSQFSKSPVVKFKVFSSLKDTISQDNLVKFFKKSLIVHDQSTPNCFMRGDRSIGQHLSSLNSNLSQAEQPSIDIPTALDCSR